MLKPFLFFLFIFFFIFFCQKATFGQSETNIPKIDKYTQSVPENIQKNLNKLTKYLTRPAQSEEEKLRNIYSWIAHHIDFDEEAYKNGNKRVNKNNEDVLKRRKAVCFGYATLMKEMCEAAGLTCEFISGYSKGTLTSKPNLEVPDHAWNCVQLNGKWHLLDATWGSSLIKGENDFVREFSEGYYLTQPQHFIVNHLPEDPMWQLLECPIRPKDFLRPVQEIKLLAETVESCYNFGDSIAHLLNLSHAEKRLKTAQNAYRFNPTKALKKELAQTHMDYAGVLSDVVDSLQLTGDFVSMTRVQERIVNLCQTAEQLGPLYEWQRNLYAVTLINLAVSRSMEIANLKKQEDFQAIKISYLEMLDMLEKGREILTDSKLTFLNQKMLEQCENQIKTVKENLEKF